MKKRKGSSAAYAGDGAGEEGFWPSYADMMSAVALILFFVMLLTYIQNLITGQSLKGTEEALAAAQEKLLLTQQEVDQKETDLIIVTANLEEARKDLDAQQIRIDEQQASIDQQANDILAQQTQLQQQQSQINEQQEQIRQQQAQAAQQQEHLNQTQAELAAVRTQMEDVAGIRMTVLNQIKTSVEQSMGNQNAVSIGENGSLVLGESVLFDPGKSELAGESLDVLMQIGHGLAGFLSDPENAKHVDTIVIGGHCDSTGSDSINYKLSQDRARVVMEQLLSCNNGELQAYKSYFSAAGYGSSRPVASNDTEDGRKQNRRIEISITLKDDSVMKILNSYLAIGSG